MWMKIWAGILSFFSFFMFWNPNGQPNNIPETRSYVGEAPDKYGIWPTNEFTVGKAPLLWGDGLRLIFSVKGNRTSEATHNDGLLVLHKGKLVYEYYGEGYDKDTPHYMASVTKSVVSALVGVAIQEGKIKSVQDKVIDYFPDAVIAKGQESKRDMTVEHLLTMTSGMPDDSGVNWWDAQDSGKAAFEVPQTSPPGTEWEYSGPCVHTLACLVSRAVGMNLFDYAKLKLFKPLGMTSVSWETADDGSSLGGFGISMTPRDMARFGYLYLNNGRWENKQIIPADYVAKTPPRAQNLKAYGYLFWNFPLSPFEGSYEANGAGGQYIEILPKWDTVIVRTGDRGWIDQFHISYR